MAVAILIGAMICGRALGGPTTRPSSETLARARAEAIAMVRPSGPIVGQPVAFNPIPPPRDAFARQFNRYTFTTPLLWNPYWGYGFWSANRPGWGWGGWGWGARWGWGGGFGVGASIQNSTGGVGW